jgi:hypothetical protein
MKQAAIAARKVIPRPQVESALGSWTFATWPLEVWPNDGAKARRVVRSNATALLNEGAISRVGREIIVFARQYDRWLRKQSHRVMDFDCAINRPENQHKRGGRHRADA